MHAVFSAVILYTQVVVLSPAAPPAALLWSDAEVAQGFAWDRDEVAFGVPDHDGDCLIEVETAQDAPYAVSPGALWAVSVPFTAAGPTVGVGQVLDPRRFPIAPGQYQLVFEARPGGTGHAFHLGVTFVRGGLPGFAILKQGSLGTDRVLSTQARRG